MPEYIKRTTYEKICAGVVSFLISVALHFGARLESFENVDFKDGMMYLNILLLAAYLMILICDLWVKAENFAGVIKTKAGGQKGESKPISMYKIWGVIFALWLPTFLAFFPGAFVYDAAMKKLLSELSMAV